MVSAIENECRKNYCCKSWGSCNCLRMLEGGRKSIIACAARPSQPSHLSYCLDTTLSSSNWLKNLRGIRSLQAWPQSQSSSAAE